MQGDKIQDYKCPQCNKEVEVTQTALMKTLPRTLLIHLKRFVWNLERGREKVNDRFLYEFPALTQTDLFIRWR